MYFFISFVTRDRFSVTRWTAKCARVVLVGVLVLRREESPRAVRVNVALDECVRLGVMTRRFNKKNVNFTLDR